MVRDAYSAGGQPQQADGGAVQPLDIRSSTASLTQELSQLLAQSIAQGQVSKRTPGVAAAGSELANLAALVSASQNQRGQQASFRDGLSSLSYARPAPQPAPLPPPAPTPVSSGSLLVAEPHDEEPMPIPSTWRQPMASEDDRWYRQQLGAAGLGLLAGLVVVVPAVLWLSGWLGGSSKPRHPVAEAAPVKVADVKPVRLTAAVDSRLSAAPVVTEPPPTVRVTPRFDPPPAVVERPAHMAVVTPAAVPPPRVERSRADELLSLARRRIENGDIPGAREILQAPESATSSAMIFMLAETFDPNMLASWQTKGINANPERARALYQKARDLGDSRAQQRLDWLAIN